MSTVLGMGFHLLHDHPLLVARKESEVDPKVDALLKACKVMLLDANNRTYMQRCDPMAYRQMVAAVKAYEPDIEDQIKNAEENAIDQRRNRAMQASANCPKCADPRNETVDPECPYHGSLRRWA